MGILDGPYVQEADEDLATGATGLKTEIQSETFYPVFVQLNTSAQNATYWIEVFFHLVNAPLPTNAKISLEPHELKFLTTIVQYEKETSQKYPADVRFFIYGNKALLDLIKNGGLLIFDADEIGKIYADFGNDSIGLKVRKDRAQNESSISFLEVGPSVQLPEEGYRIDLNILRDLPLPVRRDAGAIPEKSTLAATIDDGIGFLNERFRKEPDKTRFIEVWAQSRVKPNNDLPRVMIGKDIPRGAINGHLDQIENGETTEQSVYRDLNRELHLNTDTTSLDHSYSHGTHVLDVFAGADPVTKSDINLACVQLPPHAVRDTAGKRYEVFALLGVRWIVQKALDLAFDIGNGADMKFVPLVINVSFGTLAGPKDGTGFFEFHLAYEIERYRIITKWLSGSEQELNDGHPYPIRFTLPYGNDYRSRQVYCQQLDLEKSDTLDWRIMPDNFGYSFLELRFERTDGKVFSPPNRILELELTMPDGTVKKLPLRAVGASYVIKGKDKKPVASFHRVKEENKYRRASFVLKVHPTRKEEIGDSTDLAPAGTWRLKIEVQRRSGVFVSAQVQRGDTPGSFRRLGRQSYLDHEYAGTRDDRTGKFEAPGNSGLTRLGTHSSAATTPTAGFYTIGAAFGQSAYVARYCVEPTFYASSGAPDPRLSTSNQPSLSAVADASAIRNGVLGSGTVSGSARMVSGTSVAAPQAARRLVSYLDRNAVFGVEINPTDEKNFVLYDGVMIRGGHRRLGKGVMAPPSRQKRPAKLPTI